MTDWRPMSEFDPSKPALVHDRLNDKTIDWEPERHGKDYQAGQCEFGDGVIGIGTQGAHGAVSPQRGGIESQYISVAVADVFAHYQHALAAGARIAKEPREHAGGYRSYEAFDPEGHRWRFVHQRLREVPAKR